MASDPTDLTPHGSGALTVDRLTRRFGQTVALDGASFHTDAGRFVVLLGPSGCGKSTLLRLVAGLDTPSEGRVLIGGRDVTRASPSERGIAMVFQNYALFPHLTVEENIVFGLKARRVAADERRRRLAAAADMLGLAKLLGRRPNQLSGGQQQRVALARAVVAEAPVCLMDEPLSNLDAKLRAEMRRDIRALQRRLGMTMLYVTHDQAEAMSMADQVVLLKDGRIEQDAAPAEMYARPATLFAAAFLGTPPMNLVRLAAGPGGAVAAGSAGPAVAGGERAGLVLGVRPEDVGVAPPGEGVPARVESCEYMGGETIVGCRLGESAEAQRVAVRVPGARGFDAGTVVGLRFGEVLHFFDPATGRRLPDGGAGRPDGGATTPKREERAEVLP